MLAKIRKTIEKYSLLQKGDRVIVGFSGGIDSVCLLHLLHSLTEYKLELTALYINHSLRPEENEKEIELLKDYGKKLGVATKVAVLDIPGRLQRKPQSLQLLAREERYKIFKEVFVEARANKVALAHHRDDQAETILYRLIRGTGLDGLAGIPVSRDGIYIRPLLEVSRREITDYVMANGLRWVEDSSNRKVVYQRNRIRQQLIPQIETVFNPRFKEALVRLGKLAKEHSDFMDELVEGYSKDLLIFNETVGTGLKLAPFLDLHPHLQYYLLKKIFAGFGLEYRLQTLDIQRLRTKIITESYNFKMVHMYREISVFLEEGLICFKKNPPEPVGFQEESYWVKAPGITEIVQAGIRLNISETIKPHNWKNIPKNQVYLDAGLLDGPLKIRFWRPGDVFKPLGLQGRQKLQDYFTNEKVPKKFRMKIPLLTTADDRIIWIVGHRLADDFKVRESTDTIWRITAETTGED